MSERSDRKGQCTKAKGESVWDKEREKKRGINELRWGIRMDKLE